ncbi:MAG: translational GTPase TypA [Alphaproteobacteria bacterium]|jgi:GTP-binding protein|nr:translational GTPase TypA [Alphaproteobacteria bacterium]MBN9569432.1 translational GTPase TypA [Alphaproteobacteria bacterium]MBN9592888.1 translational GTPase TypA [Alphaproteobacteria bacterium]
MNIRNIAIIAHVDHGKTTLVDQLLRQSGAVRENQQVQERAMDSGDLERERGITILAKCTSVDWQGTRINIVDTPGHADFGGEVERILSMVDGVVLLVDAAEAVMPQTKFVLSKALKLGLKPIVVINKIDRSDAQPKETLESIFDLFLALEANDDQLDFHVLYASGRQGWAVADLADDRKDLSPLFARIVADVREPEAAARAGEEFPFAMLVTTLEADPYLGRILTGRIESGSLNVNRVIKALNRDGTEVERARATKLLAFRGLARVPVAEVHAGDIVAIAGLQTANVADTLCDINVAAPIAANPIDPPTLAITIAVNDSPLAGREGDKVQSRVIRDRLLREAEGNVAIKVRETGEGTYEVAGRGELQLGVLIETMRREGFELSISRPRVLFQTDPDTGERIEPIEEVTIDVDDPYTGVVIEKIANRKGELQDMRPTGAGKTRLTFYAPSRGLIGYHGEFLTDTRGTGVMNRMFHSYAPHKGPIEGRRNGVMISNGDGEAVAYALWYLEERGRLFVVPGTKIYQGMIVGENAKDNDLDVNPLRAKQLTNIRTTSKDEAVRLTPATTLTLEQSIAYIEDDELVEVTPKSIRLRKRELLPHLRKRARNAGE